MSKVLEYVKVTDRGIVIYPSFELFNLHRERSPRELENLKNNKAKGLLSHKSKLKIQSIINNWITSIVHYQRSIKEDYSRINNKINFITLTLPSNQIHCDKTIKRKCLNKFIITLKRKTDLYNFLWVSEKQKNGNIHFHLLVDIFINHKLIRDIWNKSLESLDYIDRFEKKHNHRDPNSTDIHSLKKVKNPSAYLIKYITKGDANMCQCGLAWNCSKSLNSLTAFTKLIDSKTADMINKMQVNEHNWVYNSEYYSIIKVQKEGVEKQLDQLSQEQIKEHYTKQYIQYLIKKKPDGQEKGVEKGKLKSIKKTACIS